ncbi:MAG TPA: hypothetical protein VFM75_02005 [Modicisalibacter sp.]|nr:hypothetical protein [Modicisalibacter sp.]
MSTAPSFDEFYEFLRQNTRHSRFEGRNGSVWGSDHSIKIAQSDYEQLLEHGWFVIDRHSSATNQVIKYDYRLVDLNADLPPVDYAPAPSNLTHIF